MYIVTPHLNRLIETVLMSGHNVCFYAAIRKIIPVTPYLKHWLYLIDEGSETLLFKKTFHMTFLLPVFEITNLSLVDKVCHIHTCHLKKEKEETVMLLSVIKDKYSLLYRTYPQSLLVL